MNLSLNKLKMIKISIIVPVYNVQKYIKGCLQSIFNQATQESDYEVIIINDGTPDNSMSIVQEFAQTHNNIIIIEQENKGLSEARNIGLKQAKGEYVWFVDSDDTIVNNSLGKIIDVLSNLDVDILSLNINKMYEGTSKTEVQHTFTKEKYKNKRITGETLLEKKFQIAPMQRFVCKLSFLQKHHLIFYHDIYHEDIEFSCKMFYYAQDVYISDIVAYEYLIRATDSIMATYKVKRSYDLIKIAESLDRFKRESIHSRKGKNIFDKKIFFCYYASVIIGFNNNESKDFDLFLLENKNKLRKAIYYTFSTNNLKNIIIGIILYINPKLLKIIASN